MRIASMAEERLVDDGDARAEIRRGLSRRLIWRACSVSVHDPVTWCRWIVDALTLVSLAHTPAILASGWATASSGTWAASGSSMLLALIAILTRFAPTTFAALVVSTILAGQTALLAMMFAGLPVQSEINLLFVVDIALAALFLDLFTLIYTTALIITAHFAFNAWAPGLLFPASVEIGRGVFHSVLCIFEASGLALVAWAVRLAVAFEDQATRAIAGLEQAGRSMAIELDTTARRADGLDKALTTFRSETSRRLDRLTGASGTLRTTAEDFERAASRATTQAMSAAQSATHVTLQVNDVAGSCEGLREMIAEMGNYARQSTDVGARAIERAVATSASIDDLTEMSERIDAILGLIAGIASQTNLLALNATIEAARAGEQGRGFVVVANEVKSLALQTTAAVANINEVVTNIRGSTARAVSAIASVAAAIGDLNDVASVIVSAVDERILAATTMADSMHVAAKNVGDVTYAVGDIKTVANETTLGASSLRDAAQAIETETAAIRHEVDAFTADVSAA